MNSPWVVSGVIPFPLASLGKHCAYNTDTPSIACGQKDGPAIPFGVVFFFFNFIYFGCAGAFLGSQRAVVTLQRRAQACLYRGLSPCRTQAPGHVNSWGSTAQAQYLGLTGSDCSPARWVLQGQGGEIVYLELGLKPSQNPQHLVSGPNVAQVLDASSLKEFSERQSDR